MTETIDRKVKKSIQKSDQVLLWTEIPENVKQAVEAIKDKKVEDIRVYDLRQFTPFIDFVILGTVFSSAQAKVAKEGAVEALKTYGLKLWGVEGDEDSGWLLVDFWDIVLHFFRPETRRYYNLEALWGDLPWWPGEISD
jgi:ribosome-associated protein